MGITVKRKNGVFQGFDFGPRKKRDENLSKSGRTGTLKSSKDSPLHGLELKTTTRPRKNGTYQGSYATLSNTNSRKRDAQKAAQRRTASSSTPSNAADAMRKIKANKSNAETLKAGTKQRDLESKMKSRGNRIQAKAFKGKYWGPDEFKGNQAKIDAWKKAGKKRNSDGSPKV